MSKQRSAPLFILCAMLILALMPSTLAEISVLDASAANLDITITSTASFLPTAPKAQISEASAHMKWYPRTTYNQKVLQVFPEPTSGGILFEWENPSLKTYDIIAQAKISTNNDLTPVTTRIPFPIKSLDKDIIQYTKPTAMIDENKAIQQLASQLVAGEDDLYAVVFNLADWVTTNIEYDLATLAANAVYPSSWVLENKYGVCDEMTNLFISLNRALGIPARFVSGVAYTNLEELNTNWGAHGWSEVYFPTIGWVPFDVTYGEYGYVDAGHIKLKDDFDSNESSIDFSGYGYGFTIDSTPLEFGVTVTTEEPRSADFIQATLKPFSPHVRIGSYNMITLTLKNLREYYVSTRVELGDTQQITHITSDEQNILLRPYEEKKLYFVVKVDDTLNTQYIYTFPVSAHTKLNSPLETSFDASATGVYHEKEVFSSYFTKKSQDVLPVQTACDFPNPAAVGLLNITCTFTQTGTESLRGNACISKECKPLTINPTATIKVQKNITQPGAYTLPVTFETRDAQSTHFITTVVLDVANISIEQAQVPVQIEYEERGELVFTLERTSFSAPENIRVYVVHENFYQEWNADFNTKQTFTLSFLGNRLNAGDNEILIHTSFSDAFGEKHSTKQTVQIALVNLTLKQKIILWTQSVNRWLEKKMYG